MILNNINIQTVFNDYKVITNICTYFSKAEDETSETMKQGPKSAFESGMSRACSLVISDLCSETKGSRFESSC